MTAEAAGKGTPCIESWLYDVFRIATVHRGFIMYAVASQAEMPAAVVKKWAIFRKRSEFSCQCCRHKGVPTTPRRLRPSTVEPSELTPHQGETAAAMLIK